MRKASPDIRVLLALAPEDISKRDLYPFAALSRGLCDLAGPRTYAVRHFAEIAHPEMKLFWAVALFDRKAASPEIVAFLKAALRSKEQAKILAESLGPGFTDLKKRVTDAIIKGETPGTR